MDPSIAPPTWKNPLSLLRQLSQVSQTASAPGSTTTSPLKKSPAPLSNAQLSTSQDGEGDNPLQHDAGAAFVLGSIKEEVEHLSHQSLSYLVALCKRVSRVIAQKAVVPVLVNGPALLQQCGLWHRRRQLHCPILEPSLQRRYSHCGAHLRCSAWPKTGTCHSSPVSLVSIPPPRAAESLVSRSPAFPALLQTTLCGAVYGP